MNDTRPRKAPDPDRAARRAQGRASRPGVSSWVGASAGTGKTWVLTRRVLRLLLDGASPARILCLTFTRAAAAEMTGRIARDLGAWALRDQAELRKDLREIIGRRPDAAEMARARTLFATCLDVPAGMRIQTIHAFCQALLKRFPLEAGVPPHFQVIEDGDRRALLDRVRNRVLAAAAPGRGRFADDLAELAPARRAGRSDRAARRFSGRARPDARGAEGRGLGRRRDPPALSRGRFRGGRYRRRAGSRGQRRRAFRPGGAGPGRPRAGRRQGDGPAEGRPHRPVAGGRTGTGVRPVWRIMPGRS